MVVQMTNRLLSIVMALAFTSGVVAHAAQNTRTQLPALPHLQLPALPRVSLPASSPLPTALRAVATSVLEPDRTAIKAAYQRDHDALEHLRQQASDLRGPAHPAFNHLVQQDEQALLEMEQSSLSAQLSGAGINTVIANMDSMVNQARNDLAVARGQANALKTNAHGHGNTGHND
jgi:hypothetical protein